MRRETKNEGEKEMIEINERIEGRSGRMRLE